MKIENVIQLKEKINECKTESAQLEGEKKALLKQLDEEWGCKTVKQAEKKLEELKESIEELDTEIEQGLVELEEKYRLQ